MKLYIVMGRYCRTQDDAKAHAKELGIKFNPLTDVEDVPTTQAELVAFLNDRIGSIFEAGVQSGIAKTATLAPAAAPAPTPVSYADLSVGIDEAFERLPVPHQLTLAALAMENARTAVIKANTTPAKPDPVPNAEDYV